MNRALQHGSRPGTPNAERPPTGAWSAATSPAPRMRSGRLPIPSIRRIESAGRVRSADSGEEWHQLYAASARTGKDRQRDTPGRGSRGPMSVSLPHSGADGPAHRVSPRAPLRSPATATVGQEVSRISAISSANQPRADKGLIRSPFRGRAGTNELGSRRGAGGAGSSSGVTDLRVAPTTGACSRPPPVSRAKVRRGPVRQAGYVRVTWASRSGPTDTDVTATPLSRSIQSR